MAAMSETRPWVTFIAVLSFLSAGFMVLGGIAMLFAAPVGIPFGGPLLGLIYLVPAVLYGVAGTLLSAYRSSIVSLQSGNGVEALERAVENQRSFWRFSGITSAVALGLYALFIAGIGVFAVM